ncbi:hypothetical protein C8R43DRAFT_961629 [Mycena crocata]|nr:hypothetical protein C8R43DRAFT_961629 [Mycena crocata]
MARKVPDPSNWALATPSLDAQERTPARRQSARCEACQGPFPLLVRKSHRHTGLERLWKKPWLTLNETYSAIQGISCEHRLAVDCPQKRIVYLPHPLGSFHVNTFPFKSSKHLMPVFSDLCYFCHTNPVHALITAHPREYIGQFTKMSVLFMCVNANQRAVVSHVEYQMNPVKFAPVVFHEVWFGASGTRFMSDEAVFTKVMIPLRFESWSTHAHPFVYIPTTTARLFSQSSKSQMKRNKVNKSEAQTKSKKEKNPSKSRQTQDQNYNPSGELQLVKFENIVPRRTSTRSTAGQGGALERIERDSKKISGDDKPRRKRGFPAATDPEEEENPLAPAPKRARRATKKNQILSEDELESEPERRGYTPVETMNDGGRFGFQPPREEAQDPPPQHEHDAHDRQPELVPRQVRVANAFKRLCSLVEDNIIEAHYDYELPQRGWRRFPAGHQCEGQWYDGDYIIGNDRQVFESDITAGCTAGNMNRSVVKTESIGKFFNRLEWHLTSGIPDNGRIDENNDREDIEMNDQADSGANQWEMGSQDEEDEQAPGDIGEYGYENDPVQSYARRDFSSPLSNEYELEHSGVRPQAKSADNCGLYNLGAESKPEGQSVHDRQYYQRSVSRNPPTSNHDDPDQPAELQGRTKAAGSERLCDLERKVGSQASLRPPNAKKSQGSSQVVGGYRQGNWQKISTQDGVGLGNSRPVNKIDAKGPPKDDDGTDVLAAHRQRNRPTKPPTVEKLSGFAQLQNGKKDGDEDEDEEGNEDGDRDGSEEDEDEDEDEGKRRRSHGGSKNPRHLTFYPPGCKKMLKHAKNLQHLHLIGNDMWPDEEHKDFGASLLQQSIQQLQDKHGAFLEHGYYPQHIEGMKQLLWDEIPAWRGHVKDKDCDFVEPGDGSGDEDIGHGYGQAEWDTIKAKKIKALLHKSYWLHGKKYHNDGERYLFQNIVVRDACGFVYFGISEDGNGKTVKAKRSCLVKTFPQEFSGTFRRKHIAFVCTMLQFAINELEEGEQKEFTAEHYSVVYWGTLKLMDTMKPSQEDRTNKAWRGWFEHFSNMGGKREDPRVARMSL